VTTTSVSPAQPPRHQGLRHPVAGETTLYLVRHGRTDNNVKQILCGWTDVPLDDFGVRQAHLVAERLGAETRVDVLLSSPLIRAQTTARIIGERIGREPVLVPGLAEMNFGDLEGLTLERILEEHPELAVRMLDFDDYDLTWPSGESRRQFHERVLVTFQSILAEYARHAAVVVAHGGVIGSLMAQISGVSPNNWRAYQLLNCSVTHLDVTPDHTEVRLFNDVVHLEVLSGPDGGVEMEEAP
jgi:broad specificity phosphatase PhoE